MKRNAQRNSWKSVEKLCRLNPVDIDMAKQLGLKPRFLLGQIPPSSVREYMHLVYRDWYGKLPWEPEPEPVSDEEAARIFEEEMYWVDYFDRNADRFEKAGNSAAPGPMNLTSGSRRP